MRFRKLGALDFSVPVIGMGCWAIAHPEIWGVQDERHAVKAIHASLDAGAHLIDTAEGYGQGRSEELVGKALVDRRDQVIIITKVSPEHHRYDDLLRACEASLRRLRTDTIDLYLLHWPSRAIAFEETVKALEFLQQDGKIRDFGLSNFAAQDLSEFLEYSPVAANQLPYNLLWRAIEYEVASRCLASKVGILCYSPLAQGLLTGRYRTPDDVPVGQARTAHFSSARPMTPHGGPGAEAKTFSTVDAIRDIATRAGIPMTKLALAWLLVQPGVTAVVAGARTVQEAIENCESAHLEVPKDVLDALDKATEDLKNHFGRENPDMWQLPGRMR